MADDNVTYLNPHEKKQVQQRLDDDFRKIFAERVQTDRQGHDSDIISRARSYEP